MQLPKYEESMLAITSSIQKYYGIDTPYRSLTALDKELAKGYKHVFMYLIDGLGYYNLQKLKKEMPYLSSLAVRKLSTVYPSTTVAATTTACCGLPPVATGWIGWHQYFKEYKEDYILFRDRGYYDETKQCPRNIEFDLMKYDLLWEQVARTGKYGSFIYPPFRTKEVTCFKDQCDMIKASANDPTKEGYTYVYWDKLDSLMHQYGVESDEVKAHASEIDRNVQEMMQSLPEDTLIILTADHGHMDIEYLHLEEHEDLVSLFEVAPTLEARAASFHIKDGKQEEFAELFEKYYGDWFVLFTHEEVFEKKLLGPGEASSLAHDFVGDFLACAIDKYCVCYKIEGPAKGQHAGMTKTEMNTPMILLSNQKKKSGKEILENSRASKSSLQGKNFNKVVGKPKDVSAFRRVNFNG
ncbi:MAG: alkaline phosphatase family protein [Erysipelotrichales bacterium]|nr:alkaline phosphatase family protein [Erysipelotrichales bacterium]